MEGLKAMIRERLHGSPLVARVLEERPELRSDPAALLQLLEERGLVEDIFASLESDLQRHQRPPPRAADAGGGAAHDPALPAAAAGSGGLPTAADSGAAAPVAQLPGRWQLMLRLLHGRAFLDYLDEREADGRELQWQVAFGSQRARCRATPAAVDPLFEETLFFELPAASSRAGLLTHAAPLHLVLVCRGPPGDAENPWEPSPAALLCSHLLDWRHCLSTAGPQKAAIELQGLGRRRQISAGVLHAELEIRPAGPAAGLVPEIGVAAQIRSEEQRREEIMRHIFESLDRWWADYHEAYRSRNVRLFAQTEGSLFLPVTSFLAPLEAGRCLDAPNHALRWATLIGTEPAAQDIGAEPRWHSFPAMWGKGRATVEEKSLLLCSLLLGFSLDAWCCLGADAQGQPHAWVVVRSEGDASRPTAVEIWDVRSGIRFSADDQRYLTGYTSIDTLFNDRRLFVCHTGVVASTSFDLSDASRWLQVPIDPEAADALRLYSAKRGTPFAELRPRRWGLPLDNELMEEAIEQRIAGALRAHRDVAGLSTRFDDHLGQLLHVALANCEFERALGVAHVADFEALARRVCAEDEVLQAVPAQFNHLRVSHFWPALGDRPTVRAILAAGPRASPRFGVRARVVPYPEGAVAVWVLVAAVGRF